MSETNMNNIAAVQELNKVDGFDPSVFLRRFQEVDSSGGTCSGRRRLRNPVHGQHRCSGYQCGGLWRLTTWTSGPMRMWKKAVSDSWSWVCSWDSRSSD